MKNSIYKALRKLLSGNILNRNIKLIKDSGLFDKAFYLLQNTDSEPGIEEPISHFLRVGFKNNKNPNKDFNCSFYLDFYPDVRVSGVNPFLHYILSGKNEGRYQSREEYDLFLINKSGLFDEKYYLENNKDSIPEGISPVLHFYSEGAFSGRNPSSEFDCTFYLYKYLDVAHSGINPLVHYITKGKMENRFINQEAFENKEKIEKENLKKQIEASKVKEEMQLIKDSGFFDANFYFAMNKDLQQGKVDPLEHFYLFGAAEGRKPSENFDCDFYLNYYADVAKSGINPLVHYIKSGKNENRFTSKLHFQEYLILQSGIFDEDYYFKSNPDLKAGEHNPIKHYLSFGSKEGRKPNAHFDPVFYLNYYPDVKENDQEPFVHYILFGEKEGRKTLLDFTGAKKFVNKDYAINNTTKIAVLIHGFYHDLIQELLDYTKNIPVNYDILISVINKEGEKTINKWTKKQGFKNKVIIKNAPNKGRDYAPAFITFRKEIAEYDLICKIHTKKSLYSGKEQVEWRRALIKPLLGNVKSVKNILHLFETDKKIGLIYPECKSFPYWAYTWLSNKISGPQIFNRLGIIDKTEGYIDYPLGSMFWFKPKAIRQLLDGRIKLSDFHDEPMPNDGTMAHALERVFTFLVKKNKFSFAEVSLADHSFYCGRGTRNLFQYTSKTLDILKEQIDKVDIVSFDVFDTLLNRPYASPEVLFINLEKYFDKKYQVKTNYYNKRKNAELNAQKKLKREVNYDDIYTEFVESDVLDKKIVTEAKKLEFDYEMQIAYSRNEVVEAFNYAKKEKRVILVSDMYLTEKQIKSLLKKNKIIGFDKLYVSSEVNKRKDRSSMWHYLIDKEKLTDSNFLHIGDNEQSDIQMAGDLRLTTFHTMSAANLFANSEIGDAFMAKYNNNWRKDRLLGPVISKIYNNPFIGKLQLKTDINLKSPFEVGYAVFGPIIYSFLSWLLEQVIVNKNDSIYFLAREGYFLKEIYEYFISFDAVKNQYKKLPESAYFLVSRRAVLGAVDKTPESLKEIILSNDFEGNVVDLFYNRMGVDLSIVDKKLANKKVKTPDDIKVVNEIIEKHIDYIIKKSKEEKVNFNKYLKEIAFYKNENPAIVDLGYSATIQRYLEDITKQKMDGYYFVTRKTTQKWTTETNRTFGYFENNAADFTDNPIYKFSLFLEAWLTSPDGQLKHFTKNNDKKIIPVFKEKEKQKKDFDINEEITRGVKKYIQDLINSNLSFIKSSDINLEKVQFLYEQFVRRDVWDEKTRKIYYLENDFCGHEEFNIVEHYTENVIK